MFVKLQNTPENTAIFVRKFGLPILREIQLGFADGFSWTRLKHLANEAFNVFPAASDSYTREVLWGSFSSSEFNRPTVNDRSICTVISSVPSQKPV